MLIPEFEKLRIKEPHPELKEHVSYGDFVEVNHKTTPVNDIEDIRSVLEEQCEESLLKVRNMRGETPIAIWFYLQPHPKSKDFSFYGWQGWVDKRK